ncbi:MAG: diphthine synthase [Candidatus Methanofastidiosa archaeon]|jgi:diphthine synthase|nr:diphthine synthase [Candidatus Methanofastidiosa archaeon]MDD4280978.1 diphthine synthase [Candidatus Methanofastidiosa archaeon]
MLIIAGLGLDGNGITVEALRAVQTADVVYAEFYTSLPQKSPGDIGASLGVSITPLSREEVEERELPLAEAASRDVAFLVMGDPLVATTHISLVDEARRRGIHVKVFHAASIFSAVGSTGLMLYKFGKAASIVYPEENYIPKSFYETVVDNIERGLHTLLFLDLKADKGIYMDPVDGLDILSSLDGETRIASVIVASRIGWDSENIVYGTLDEVRSLGKAFFGPPPHCIVVPGTLHFAEEDYLAHYRVR